MLRLQRKPGEAVDLYDNAGGHIGRVVMTKNALIFQEFSRDVKILRTECSKRTATRRVPALQR